MTLAFFLGFGLPARTIMVMCVSSRPTSDAMALEETPVHQLWCWASIHSQRLTRWLWKDTPVHNIGGDTASRCVLSARLVELDLCGGGTLGTRKYQTIYSDSRVPARHQTALLPHLFVTKCFFAGKLTPCLQLTWPGAGRGNTSWARFLDSPVWC